MNIWDNIEERRSKDFISRPYTSKEEAMIYDWLSKNEPKKYDFDLNEYCKNMTFKQLDITKVEF